jgi:hypothetical protein
VLILGACFLLGAQVLDLVRRAPRDEPRLPLAERSLFSLATGMLTMGLVVLAIGLLGWLRPWVLWIALGGACLIGARQVRVLLEALSRLGRGLRDGLRRRSPRRALRVFLLVWSAFTLLGALAPSTDLDYDGLSQHLAAPKTYLRHGRIFPLWYDHHSQFPSTLQMLYTVGLATGPTEAPKLLHWACGVLTGLALIVIGRRMGLPAAGEWAALALFATPIVGWLGTVAYVDLAGAFFAALLLLAFLRWLSARAAGDLLLAAVAAGGGMAVKTQGLEIFAVAVLLVAAGLLAREGLLRSARQGGVFVLVALVPAAPWYLKSLIWTGNPVYPFAYGVFGGKYWGPAEAAQYHEHQLGFGVGEPPPPAERAQMGFLQRTFSGPRAPLNLVLAPWNLAMRPVEFDVLNINPVFATASGGLGPLFLAVLPLLLLTGAPRPVRWSLAFFAFAWLSWLMLMQYNRYLVPALVFAALPAGYVLGEGLPPKGVARIAPRAVAGFCAGLALLYLAFSGLLTGAWAAGIGLVPRDAYLETNSECYRVSQWVNKVTPARAKLALYSEPRGFYLDRDYLWADPGHSRLIEYDKIKSPQDLLDAYSRLGVTHVLYHQLPGAPDLFDLAPYGTALEGLEREGEVSTIGHPPYDPSYVLLAIETPWAKELTQ